MLDSWKTNLEHPLSVSQWKSKSKIWINCLLLVSVPLTLASVHCTITSIYSDFKIKAENCITLFFCGLSWILHNTQRSLRNVSLCLVQFPPKLKIWTTWQPSVTKITVSCMTLLWARSCPGPAYDPQENKSCLYVFFLVTVKGKNESSHDGNQCH